MNTRNHWLPAVVVCVICLGFSATLAENWPGWRGPRGDGTCIEKNLPTQWGPDKNILWKTEIPGVGHSSPIVWENNVFVTSAVPDKQQRLLLCIEALSGKILWQQVVLESPLEKIHDENSYASGTPATDGQKVYVAFLAGKEIVISAYDFTGKRIWQSRLDAVMGPWGFGSSPVLYDGQVILNCDGQEGSFLVSLSCTDGHTVWNVSDANKKLSFTTPLIRPMAGRTQLVLSGNQGVYSYNPDDGSLLWFVDGVDEEFISTPVYHQQLQRIFIASSYSKKKFLAIDVTGSGDVTKTHVAWSVTQGVPNINSPVIAGDSIYGVDQRGQAQCIDAKTGNIIWSENLGRTHASPVLIEDLIYFINDDGVAHVIKAGPEYKLVSKNELGQMCYASPAISDGRIYLRGKTHLFCIANALTRPRTFAHPENSKLPTVWIVGDSTVKNNTTGQQGWGDPIAAWFDADRINVCNRALGGRSSRTFITEGLWDNVLSEMKAGDFILIQFGHNDNGPLNTGRARASLHSNGDETQEVIMEATGQKEVVHSYGWYIRKYIADTKAKDATPIILSLVPRNIWKEDGTTVVRATDDFTLWASEAAKQGEADFVDLNNIIATHYETEGQKKVKTQFFLTDHTHTTPAGAQLSAACVVEGLKQLKGCKLCEYLLSQPKN